jgi:hypothetical protein
MVLTPCPGCRRHVATDDLRCPFCGVAHAGGVPRAIKMISGRWSRAAVFAGGALVAPACGPATTEVKAPSPTEGAAVTRPGRIVGKVTGDRTGAPITGAIQFFDAANKAYTVTPDGNGDYVLEVPPGTYRTYKPPPPRRRATPTPPTEITAVVKAGETATVNLTFPEYDPHRAKMPYGAPPARRRIV